MPGVHKSFATMALAAVVFALAIAGCGSGSSSSSTETSTTAPGSQPTTSSGSQSTSPTQGASQEGEGGAQNQQPSRGTGEEFGKNDPYSAPKGGDNSIQTYGNEAKGGEEAAVTGAMFAFFRAMASQNYSKVCEGLSGKTREGVEQFLKAQHKTGTCSTFLKTLVGANPGATKEAKKAAEGSVGHVRIGEGNAFVLFTPAGGKPSYFVMKEESGEWKATGVNTGSPLNP
jgi:hypothetical protein